MPKGVGGGKIEIGTLRSDGNYISNDWTKDTNGEGYLKRIKTKRPDIQQRVADIRPRVEAVNWKFEVKYGWDKPASGLLKQSEVPATFYSALGVEEGKITQQAYDENPNSVTAWFGRDLELDHHKYGNCGTISEMVRVTYIFEKVENYG